MAKDDEHPTRTRNKRSGEIVAMPEVTHPAQVTEARGALAFVDRARDVLTVKRVFGEPIERDGVTIIPAANVRGGGGGGGDTEGNGGGGFGVSASPAGAFVIKDGVARWRPAIDVNRTVLMGQLVGIVLLLTVRSIVKTIVKRR